MLDPVTFGAILPALLLAASAAVYLPARRARGPGGADAGAEDR
jgi:hypothetical protein